MSLSYDNTGWNLKDSKTTLLLQNCLHVVYKGITHQSWTSFVCELLYPALRFGRRNLPQIHEACSGWALYFVRVFHQTYILCLTKFLNSFDNISTRLHRKPQNFLTAKKAHYLSYYSFLPNRLSRWHQRVPRYTMKMGLKTLSTRILSDLLHSFWVLITAEALHILQRFLKDSAQAPIFTSSYTPTSPALKTFTMYTWIHDINLAWMHTHLKSQNVRSQCFPQTRHDSAPWHTVELIPYHLFCFQKIPTSKHFLLHERLGFHTKVGQVDMTILHGIL